jgi:hypothetical protein
MLRRAALWLRGPSQSERPRTDSDHVFGAGRMPTDSELRQEALTGRGSASRHVMQ